MDEEWKKALWSQFGATIDMLGNAMHACPNDLWHAPMWQDPNIESGFAEFWYVAYHTLFWLDLYLSGSDEGFMPPAPFDNNELDGKGLLPKSKFTREELEFYMAHCRQKCHDTIMNLSDEKASQVYKFPWKKEGLSFAELLLDNMRHVQEHGAQLNMFLGQQAEMTTRWLAAPKPG